MQPTDSPLAKELAFFNAHLAEWLPHHEGKFALVKDEQSLGFFDSWETAYAEGVARLGAAPMLIRQVVTEQRVESAPALMLGVIHART